MRGPIVTILKGTPYHFKLYDLPKDSHVTMRVKHVLDSGESVYTNELEIKAEQSAGGDGKPAPQP